VSVAAAAVAGVRRAERVAVPRESLAVRVGAFAALASVGAVEWQGLIVSPPTARTAGVVGIVTAGALALALALRLPLPARLRTSIYAAIVLVAAVAACLAAGLPAHLLRPARWDTLGDGLDRGLVGAGNTNWPYTGADPWVRLTLMLGIPLFAVPAMALAVWPRRRPDGGGIAGGLALVLLVALYAIPATERDAGAPVARGLLLLALIGAWLWLPRLRGSRVLPGLVALGVAALLALPVAAALEGREAWVDYTTWNLFSDRAGGRSFVWTHQYGPLDWPRTGDTMLEVKAPRQHYWKTETLDRFDGLRWVHSEAGHGADPTSELPLVPNPRWQERMRFTIRGLKTDLLVGAGTVYEVDGDNLLVGSADGTIRVLDGPLTSGDSYTVEAYVPDPSARQMRAAPVAFRTQFLSYTYFDLPRPGDSAVGGTPPSVADPGITARTVGAPLPGRVPGDRPEVLRRILSSPYARMYRLAQELALDQKTPYGVVRKVERYLQRGYTYDERPPLRKLPLNAFLFRDKVGYCQQFSGAMALLLRMVGIPARVASGFAPGIPDQTTGEYRVRDLDAHSWVEVWFEDIGWVPFDPTPTSAPASAQASGDALPSAATGGHDSGKDAATKRRTKPADLTVGEGPSERSPTWAIVLVVLALPLAGVAALWIVALLRARRVRRAGGDPDLRELRFALERLGHGIAPSSTLLDLERRLRVTAGPGAASYVRALRERRFARAAASRLDRRALRRGLTAGRGPIVSLRALLVLPPRRHRAS
jgi:protein-glutamine gamma-glutamyltransferase